jgi:hypothetical protein
MIEAYTVVNVDGYGLGVILEEHTHYSLIQFNHGGHRWQVAIDKDDYRIIGTIGHEEIL